MTAIPPPTASHGALGVVALPLALWERDGMKTALAKAGLPVGDIDAADRFFWRFEHDDTPAGFGGLELYGGDAVLRSIVTLAPVRGHGIGTSILAMLETEAAIAGCRTAWVAATSALPFLEKRGYARADAASVPPAVRATAEFAALLPAGATPMMKSIA